MQTISTRTTILEKTPRTTTMNRSTRSKPSPERVPTHRAPDPHAKVVTGMRLPLSDEAVSGVIGTVLVVALVVIFASISAAFIFGSIGEQEEMKVVCISGTANSNGTATFTVQGGGDLPRVEKIMARYPDGTSVEIFGSRPSAGDSATTGRDVTGERVILVGSFEDNTQQMIYDGRF